MAKTGEKLWWSLFYDMDTIFGIDNEGQMHFHPFYEFNDQEDGQTSYVYNGNRSLLFERLNTCFPNEIRAMYQSMRTGNWTRAKILENYDKNQTLWAERLYNENAYIKYLEPFVIDGDDTYFEMLLGNGRSHRHYFINNRIDYLDSKFNAGEALTNVATVRGYQSANLSVKYLTPMYCSIKYGSQLVQVRQKVANTLTAVPIPAGMSISDTETYIYSAQKLTEISGLDAYQIGYADFTQATALRKLLIGKHSDETFTNTHFATLRLGSNRLLEELDVAGCTALTGNIDISNCTGIEKAYFDRTAITGLTVPYNRPLGIIWLPNTIRTLYLKGNTTNSLYYNGALMTSNDFTQLTQMLWENSTINSIDIVKAVMKLPAGCYTRVLQTGMQLSTVAEAEALVDKLATLKGIDENGNLVNDPQFGGTLYIDDYMTQSTLQALQALMPYVTITCKGYVYSVKIYGADMQTLTYNQTFNAGSTLPTLSTYIPAQYNEGRIGSKYCVQNGGYIKLGSTKTIYESATWDSHKTDLDGATINSDIEIGGNFTESDITFQVKYRYYYQNIDNYIDLLQSPKTVTYGQPFTLTEPDSITVSSGNVYDVLGSHAVESSKNHVRQQADPKTYYVPVNNVFTVPFADVDFKKTQSVGGYIYTGEVYCIADDDIVDTAYGVPLNNPFSFRFSYPTWSPTNLDTNYIATGKNILVFHNSTSSATDFLNTYITTPSSSDYQTVLDLINSATGTLGVYTAYVPVNKNLHSENHVYSDYVMLVYVTRYSSHYTGLKYFFQYLTKDRVERATCGNMLPEAKYRQCCNDLNVTPFISYCGLWGDYNISSRFAGNIAQADSYDTRTTGESSRPRVYNAIGTEYTISSSYKKTFSNGSAFITAYTVDHSGICTGTSSISSSAGSYKISSYGMFTIGSETGLPYTLTDNSLFSGNNVGYISSHSASEEQKMDLIWFTLNHSKDTDYGHMTFMGFVGFGSYQFIHVKYKVELLDGTMSEMYEFDTNDTEFCTYPPYTFSQIKKIWIHHYDIWKVSMVKGSNTNKHRLVFGTTRTDFQGVYIAHVYSDVEAIFNRRLMLSRDTKAYSTDIGVTPVCEMFDKSSRYSSNVMGKNNNRGNAHWMEPTSVTMNMYLYDTVNKTVTAVEGGSTSLINHSSKILDENYKIFTSTNVGQIPITIYYTFSAEGNGTITKYNAKCTVDNYYIAGHDCTEDRAIIFEDILDPTHPKGSYCARQLYDHYINAGTSGHPLSREYVVKGGYKSHEIIDETLFQSMPQNLCNNVSGVYVVTCYVDITTHFREFYNKCVTEGTRYAYMYNVKKETNIQCLHELPVYSLMETMTWANGYAYSAITRQLSYCYQSTGTKPVIPSSYAFVPWVSSNSFSTGSYTAHIEYNKPTKSSLINGMKELIFYRLYSRTTTQLTSTHLSKFYIMFYTAGHNQSGLDAWYMTNVLAVPFMDLATEHTTAEGYKYYEVALKFDGLVTPVIAHIGTTDSSIDVMYNISYMHINSYFSPIQYDELRTDDRLVSFESLALPNAVANTYETSIQKPIFKSLDTSTFTNTLAEWKAIAYGTS